MTADPRRGSLLVDVAIVVLSVLAFGPGMTAGLTLYDDSLYIYLNTEVLGRPGWAGLLNVWDSSRAWKGEFVEFFPLRDTVYWLIFQRWNVSGPPYHLASLFFHIIASLLLTRVGPGFGLSWRASAVAALLFAVHPIHIESVEWAAGLKDPMYSAFLFGSVLAYQRYRVELTPWRYGLALVLCVMSLLVKSMGLTLPLVLVALERLSANPTPWKVVLQRVTGFGLVCGLFLGQFLLIGRANHAVTPPHGGGWGPHVVLSAWAQVKYLKQSFVPSTFRLIYCFEPPPGLVDWRLGVAVLVAAAVFVALWRARRNQQVLLAAIWYGACLLTVSNLVPFPAVMADRYLYAAVWGACVVVALVLERLRPHVHRLAVGLILVGLTATSASRSALWNDQENLWEETDEDPICLVDTAPAAADAHLLRYWTAKDRRNALMAIERSIITPGLTESARMCDTLESGAHQAAALGFPERGEPWARMAAANPECASKANTWLAVMVTSMHRKPAIAAAAAERAWRLSRSPPAKVMLGAMRVEAGQPEGVQLVLEAVKEDARACRPFLTWSESVPALAPKFGEAIAWCLGDVSPAP
jgi:hypothetical protein